MYHPRNPADMLSLDRAPSMHRLLRACGTDEAYMAGPASDYDKFLALAAALPLCEGHPLRDEVNARLSAATGLSAPLCPHTARFHWDAWVEIYLYGREVPSATLPTVCPYCSHTEPTILQAKDLAILPNPVTVKAPDLFAWTALLETYLSVEKDGIAWLNLPADYDFARPNPYHANLAVGKVSVGEILTPVERSLLYTQALRVWGLRSVACSATLLLHGGSPEAVTALLAYLNTSRALPSLIWISEHPADAEAVSGLYATVRTGYAEHENTPPEIAEALAAAYAAVAPIGRAVRWVQ